MREPFDPYWHWLAIPPAEQPPDHYRLRGLRRFEGDTRLIAVAAQSRIDHVRSCDDGHHPESVERVLEHLAAARDTLLNPKLKAQYDHLISQQRPAQPVSDGRPTAAPTTATSKPLPSAAPPVNERVAPAVNVVARSQRRANGARLSPMSLVVCAASGALALALGLALWLGPGNEPTEARPSQANGGRLVAGAPGPQKAPSPRTQKTASSNGRGTRAGGVQEPLRPAPRPRGPETMADLVGAPDDTPAHVSTLTGKLAAARRAMWSRDLAAARQHMDAANRQAQTPTERDETQRLGGLLDALEAFWTAVRHGAERLEGAEELRLGDRPVLVVEAGPERLIIRDAGQNFTYPTQDLPREIAIALAMRSMRRGHPTTNLRVGAFLAVDKRGDRGEARTCWQQAGEKGNALLPELALAPPPEPPQAEPKAPSPVVPGAMIDAPPQTPLPAPVDDPPVASPPVDRAPLPDAGTLGPAEKLVQELFQDDLQAARTPESKRALSGRLLDVARDTNDDPAACYVLCRIARDLAVEVGDPDAFCPVIDELDRRYQIDGLAMKAAAFTESWRSPTAAPYRPALAEQSLGLLSSAIQAKQYEAAQQFLRVAQYGARAAKNYQLLRQLDEQARQINAALRSSP